MQHPGPQPQPQWAPYALLSWHPVPAFRHPDSSRSGPTGTAPSSHGFLGLRREPSPQALAAPRHPFLSRWPHGPAGSPGSPLPSPLLPSAQRSGDLRPEPHRWVRSGTARLSRFRLPAQRGVGWFGTPRFQSPRRRLLMPKAASRNAPCPAAQLHAMRTLEYCVTLPRPVGRPSKEAIGRRREKGAGLSLRNQRRRLANSAACACAVERAGSQDSAISVTIEITGPGCPTPGKVVSGLTEV